LKSEKQLFPKSALIDEGLCSENPRDRSFV
ncbi:MAG: hypothetical protein ACI9A1_001044, partial [Lentimonas sp.]